MPKRRDHQEEPSSSKRTASKRQRTQALLSDVGIEDEDKRQRPWVKSMPSNVSSRISRALTQRMFLVERSSLSVSSTDQSPAQTYEEDFQILGSIGNVYKVHIGQRPSCTCPDASSICKHILFVYLRVLRIPKTSPLIYQHALTPRELREMFKEAAVDPTVLANAQVRSTFAKLMNKEIDCVEESGPIDCVDESIIKRRPIEGDCPICFEPLQEGPEALVWCQTSCGNNMHEVCFKQWESHLRQVTCVYCRAPWPKTERAATASGGGVEGYLNLANLQGVSMARDISSYSSWWRQQHGYE